MNIATLEALIEDNKLQEIYDLLNKTPQLADQKTSHGVSPVLLACYYRKPKMAELIAGFSTEITVFEACALGQLEHAIGLITEQPELVNTFANDGFTPLGLAAYFGHEELAKVLITSGAEVNVPTNNGFNVFPIHSAVAARNYNITKMLLDAGAAVNVKQQAGFTPLHAAAQYGDIEILILLLEHNADVDIRMEGGKLPADLADEKGYTEIAAILRN
ncbi:ankyrin repeat domain-containing protein [Pedobacter frigoris]|uniref:ankyrin repeat domain-containing protein n=1 Tax=Pedobacter frigoris TaxID=2571272 RepID=UPI00292E426A|nr:ankyrin repeat domain-containing protein [Pedobacter frigoris]